MPEGNKAQQPLVLLDLAIEDQRSLTETVGACGMKATTVVDVEAFTAIFAAPSTLIGIVAYEALWPQPQRRLQTLRESNPRARILVFHEEDSPRLRLGERLWSVGLIDTLLSRATPPHQVAPILRQARAEALLERDEAQQAGASITHENVRALTAVVNALINKASVDDVLRELHLRLPRIVDYLLMQVLVLVSEHDFHLHVFQTSSVEHASSWALTEAISAASQPFVEESLAPDRLFFVESATIPAGAAAVRPSRDEVVLPMVQRGELVGCLGIAFPAACDAEKRMMLKLLALQLGSTLCSAQAASAAERVSAVDALTGAHNRRYLDRVLSSEWARAGRYRMQLTVALIGVDHFKKINSSCGHLVGDHVLRNLVTLLFKHLRDTDHLVRYHADQFLLLLPETGASEAVSVLERFCSHLRQRSIYSSEELGTLQISISGGVATYPTCEVETPEALLELTEQALTWAKSAGRDRICISGARATTISGSIEDSRSFERRRHPRIASQLRARMIDLPEFGGNVFNLETSNISAGGVAVFGPDAPLRDHGHGLVFLEDDQKPVLAQIVWTRDAGAGQRSAGLRFLRGAEVGALLHRGEQRAQSGRPKALLIADNPQTIGMVERALCAAHYECHLLDDRPSPGSLFLDGYPLVIVGESMAEGSLIDEITHPQLDDHAPDHVVLVNETFDRSQALELAYRSRVNHLVASGEGGEAALFSTLSKLVAGDFFGLKKYLLWGTALRTWTVKKSADKAAVISALAETAVQVGCHVRLADLLLAGVEEMIIHALARGSKAKDPVTIELGCDGRLLAVSVLDKLGALQSDEFFRNVGDALRLGGTDAGAQTGLGFRVILSTLSQLVINVDPGRRTEIIGVVELGKSLREQRIAPPNYGLFSSGD